MSQYAFGRTVDLGFDEDEVVGQIEGHDAGGHLGAKPQRQEDKEGGEEDGSVAHAAPKRRRPSAVDDTVIAGQGAAHLCRHG